MSLRTLPWILFAALIALSGCVTRRSLLTTTPALALPSAAGAAGDVQAHSRVTTFVDPMQPEDPETDVIMITPRVAVGAAGTLRIGRFFAMRPMLEVGLPQRAITGYDSELNYGDMPSLIGGMGFMFRIAALEERFTVDIEADPLLGWSVLRTDTCTSDYTICSATNEEARYAFLPRGSLVLAYQMAPWVRGWVSGGAAAQPIVNDSLAAVGVVGTGIELTPHPMFSTLIDVSWPFAGSTIAYGPTVALAVRINIDPERHAGAADDERYVLEE